MSEQRERILLVEKDDETIDLIAQQTLRPLGYQVEVVGQAATAIRESALHTPDVAIVSMDLPDLSGKDLLVALSSQGVSLPVIVIGGKGRERDIIQAFRLGAWDYVNRPIREAEVVSAVERVLKQVRERREQERLVQDLGEKNRALEQKVRELSTILAIGKSAISPSDQEQLFDRIVQGAIYLTEADRGWLLLLEGDGDDFYLNAYQNLPRSYAEKLNKPWEEGLTSIVILSGDSLSIYGGALKRFKVSHLGGSILIVPIKAEKEIIGILAVAQELPKPFTTGDRTRLESFADYAASSLVNLKSIRALKDRVDPLRVIVDKAPPDKGVEVSTLRNVGRELISTLDSAIDYVEDLIHGPYENPTGKQIRSLELLLGKLGHMNTIVTAMSSLEEERRPQNLEAVDLNNLAREAVRRFHPLAQERGIGIEAEILPEPFLVEVDKPQIAHVFDVTLSTALRNVSKSERVTIIVEGTLDGERVHVWIRDTGPGIAEKDLEHIFEPFHRKEVRISKVRERVGIGLSIAKEIVTSHGGKMWAESELGKGSTFHFDLPLLK